MTIRRGLLLAALLGVAAIAVAAFALSRDDATPAEATEGPPGFRGITPERRPMIFDIGGMVNAPELREDAFAEARNLGSDAVRILVPWRDVAPLGLPDDFRPTDPADPNYDWSIFDPALKAAKRQGLKILLAPSGRAPDWASAPGSEGVAEPDPAQFGEFVTALARRYNGEFDPDGPGGPAPILPEVSLWTVWNEPNLSIFLEPQFKNGRPYSPLLYRKLYFQAQRAIEAEHPGTQILIGEIAPTGGNISVDPIPFVREVLCLDPQYEERDRCPYADEEIDAVAWSAHPYALGGRPPFEPVPNPDYVTMNSLATLAKTLDSAASAGAIESELPIYITEYGIQSVPDPNAGVTLDHQAEYFAIAEKFVYADPRVKTFAQYLLRDDIPEAVPGTPYGGFESGLRFYDGRKKPALDAFRLPLAVQRLGERVSLWGIVQPYAGPTAVTIRYKDPGEPARDLQDVPTTAAGVFFLTSEYRRDRLWLVRWRSPLDGRTYRSPWYRSYQFAQPAIS